MSDKKKKKKRERKKTAWQNLRSSWLVIALCFILFQLSDVKAVNKSPETSKAQAQVAKIAADKRTEQREKVSHAATKPKKVTEKVEKNATQEKTDKDKTLKVEQSATQKKIDKEKDKILKLDSKTVRKKLEKSGNLAELQKRLSKFSDSAAKVQKAKDNRAKTTERYRDPKSNLLLICAHFLRSLTLVLSLFLLWNLAPRSPLELLVFRLRRFRERSGPFVSFETCDKFCFFLLASEL